MTLSPLLTREKWIWHRQSDAAVWSACLSLDKSSCDNTALKNSRAVYAGDILARATHRGLSTLKNLHSTFHRQSADHSKPIRHAFRQRFSWTLRCRDRQLDLTKRILSACSVTSARMRSLKAQAFA
jgi:hypothetical protein